MIGLRYCRETLALLRFVLLSCSCKVRVQGQKEPCQGSPKGPQVQCTATLTATAGYPGSMSAGSSCLSVTYLRLLCDLQHPIGPIFVQLESSSSMAIHPVIFLYTVLQHVLDKLLSPTPPAPHAHLSRPKIAVIGAGLTGVSSASHCVGHGFDVTIFEAGDEKSLGGIWSVNMSIPRYRKSLLRPIIESKQHFRPPDSQRHVPVPSFSRMGFWIPRSTADRFPDHAALEALWPAGTDEIQHSSDESRSR